jgi:hypothetical protein
MVAPLFPTLATRSWPVNRQPVFNNQRTATNWGRRAVSPMRLLPTWSYELRFDLVRSDIGYLEFQQLLHVYLATLGGALYFRYDDETDNTVTLQPSGQGDGSTTAFELTRTQSSVGFAEPVRSFNGTPHIFLNGIETTSWSIDATGIVNFTGPVGAGVQITWTGAYYWLCRFDEDQLPLSNFLKNWWECKSVKFSTDLLG